ncbi:MAG: spermidine synthase [Actinomycetota bacterium]|nr:spermidine synthase [Actinomycetota bacterium]
MAAGSMGDRDARPRVSAALVRGLLGAAAFAIAIEISPNIAWSKGTTTRTMFGVLAIIGVLAAVLPAVVDRIPVLRRSGKRAIALGTVLVDGGSIIGLSVASRYLHLGLQLSGLRTNPLDVALAVLLATVVAALPILLELRLRAITRIGFADALRPRVGGGMPVLLIFLLSGASGLMYEVVWSRQLVLVFGNTTQAVSAILTGYFGGLAIGSVLGGRMADRVRRPLALYGVLELVLVVVVLATPILFRGLHDVYRSGYGALEAQPLTLALIRYALALLALAPATILMGATLPTLSRHLSRSAEDLGGSFGRLYTVNTIGAVAGTALAGLVLIELVGLSGTLYVGAAGSATAGMAAIALDRLRRRRDPWLSAVTSEPVAADAAVAVAPVLPLIPERIRRIAIVVAFVSGLTSLGYQVVWTRMLASGSGNSTYVFTLILATFLVGLSIGAAYVARRRSRSSDAIAWLGAAQIAVAAIALLGLPVVTGIVAASWPLALRVLIVVLPTTLVMGVTLPMASSLIGLGTHRLGRDAGLLLGANTLGAIFGTFVIPFVVIPIIGSPRSLVVLCLVNLGLGVALVLRGTDLSVLARRSLAGVASGLTVLAVVGLVIPNGVVADPGTNRMAKGGTVYAATEDEIAAVQAGSINGAKRLYVGGNGMTALTVDAKLMALMPEFVQPSAQRMLVIAFGMGSTYRSGLRSGLTVDGVELVPSVPQMLGHFQPDAAAVLQNPRGRVIIADGRNYVELTDERYDIVVVDPPPPIQSSGTVVLYSQEFYRAAASRLNVGGVMMEWMPGGQTVDEFRAHVRTFSSVFADVLLAFGPSTHGVYMLGSASPVTLDQASIASVLSRPGVIGDLDEAADAPTSTAAGWLALMPTLAWIGGTDVARFGETGPLITDDRPLTEYFLLRQTFGPRSPPMTMTNLRAAVAP